MSQISKLLQVTEDEKKQILRKHNVTADDFEESVKILTVWVNQNEHFPNIGEPFSDHLLRQALLTSKMRIELAKKVVEYYFTMKVIHKDFYQKITSSQDFSRILRLVEYAIMPKLLPNLCRLHVAKLTDHLGEAETGLDYYIQAMMTVELSILNDFIFANEIVLDIQHFNLKMMLKFTPIVNMTILEYWRGLHLRIHKVHILNPTTFFEKFMSIVKPILPTKMAERIVFHRSLEELHKEVPKEYLPSDYGGTERPLSEIFKTWTDEWLANRELFDRLKEYKAKSLPPQLQESVSDNYLGVDGSFRKLAID